MPRMHEWARNEIDRVYTSEGNKNSVLYKYINTCYESAYNAYEALLKYDHSGCSIQITRNILNRLINCLPLTPIEDEPDIWTKIEDFGNDNCEYYQCTRMFSLFKKVYPDGTVTYHDHNRFHCVDVNDPKSVGWTSGFVDRVMDELYPIAMPYSAPGDGWTVYCEDHEDNDIFAILYAINPDGEKVTVEKYFIDKADNDQWEEITKDDVSWIVIGGKPDDKLGG